MFIYNSVRRIIHGRGCSNSLPNEVKRLGGSKVFLVTSPTIRKNLLPPMESGFEKAGLTVEVFSNVPPDPKIEVAEQCLAAAKSATPDVIVGIGGGSVLDIAKVVAALMTNQGPVEKYFGVELVPSPALPFILLPTTAGTGSEVTSISVLSDPVNKLKKAVVSEHMYATSVMLDPELTLGLPPKITATSGMDALVHAIESFTGTRATPFTDALNMQAIGLIAANLRKAYARGQDIDTREAMLNASCIAGLGFSNTQTALVHAIALAVGGRYPLGHGQLTAAILPWVMEYNLIATPEKFITIARLFGEKVDSLSDLEAARRSVSAVRSLLTDLDIPFTLKPYGVTRESLPDIAKGAIGAVRVIPNNPRNVTLESIEKLLEENYD